MSVNHPDLRGKFVKDKVSGLEGVVTSIAKFMSGAHQSCISPKVKDDDPSKIEKAYYIDTIRLAVLRDDIEPGAIDPYTVKLGDKVKDAVTDIEGTITAIVECLDGCVLLEVQPALTGKERGNIKPDILVFDHKRAIPTGKAVETKRANTGGPMRAASELSQR